MCLDSFDVKMRGGGSKALFQLLAVAVSLWFCSHLLYVVDEGYRASLRSIWKIRNGDLNYNLVLTDRRMKELHESKKRDFLEGHNAPRNVIRPWKNIEDMLEQSLLDMFERTDKLKAWELKKMGNAAWHDAFRELKAQTNKKEISPAIRDSRGSDRGVNMENILVYNRIPKSGSTMMLSFLYELGRELGYLVLRGKFHSYRYFVQNDRSGLGYFLEQSSTRARTAYVQHQYYVNFTQTRQHQPIYMNLMRDPVDHLISSYYYKRTVILQHRGPEEMTLEERRILTEPIEQCVIERRLECVYYGYTVHKNKTEQLEFRKKWSPEYLYPSDVLLYFCGHDEECSELGNPLALAKAKHNVDVNFRVVGLLEHMEETVAVLEEKIPQFFRGLSDLYDREKNKVKNKNSVKGGKVPAEIREALRERLANEYDLYYYIRQKLLRQYRQIIK